jgi:thiamine transport system ATP-binding protein
VTLGLRPTALRLAEDGIAGKLIRSVHRRDHVRLLVKIEHREVDAVAGITNAPQPGQTVRLRLDPDGLAVLRGHPGQGE